MGDELSALLRQEYMCDPGPGAPEVAADNAHYVYSGVDLGQKPARVVPFLVGRDASGRLTVEDYLAHERTDAVAREPYQRELLKWLARGGRICPLALPRLPVRFTVACPDCCQEATSIQALRELCACPEPKPLPCPPLGVRRGHRP